jgi:glucan phosphoethanolaminetransferase (alkaline phosphatase superfamily)
MGFYYSFFHPLTNTVKESFANETDPSLGLLAMIALIVLVVVQVFIVQLLWNKVIVTVVSGVKPLRSFWLTLGMVILIAMLFPGSL